MEILLPKNSFRICGSADLGFKENKKSLESIPNINKKIIEFINAPESLKRAEKELKFMEKNNVNHLFYTDKNYPSNLKLCMDSPVNLFYKGSIAILEMLKGFS